MKEYRKPKLDILYVSEDVICESCTYGVPADDWTNWTW